MTRLGTRYSYLRQLCETHKGDRAVILAKCTFHLDVTFCHRLLPQEELAENRAQYPSEQPNA